MGPELSEYYLGAHSNTKNKIWKFTRENYIQHYVIRDVFSEWVSRTSELSKLTQQGQKFQIDH